jgi:hypothetical protein
MRSDLTVAEQNQSVVRLKANSRTNYAAIAFVVALFAYSQAKARQQYPGQYADARHVNGTRVNPTRPGSSCCSEADAHDYFGDYAINLDGSVVLKSGVIPYRIEPYKVLDGPNPTGRANLVVPRLWRLGHHDVLLRAGRGRLRCVSTTQASICVCAATRGRPFLNARPARRIFKPRMAWRSQP